jgi:hypothetical protein
MYNDVAVLSMQIEISARPPLVVCSTSRPLKGREIIDSSARVKALPASAGPRFAWSKNASNCSKLSVIPACEGCGESLTQLTSSSEKGTYIGDSRVDFQDDISCSIVGREVEWVDDNPILEAVHAPQSNLLRGQGDIGDSNAKSSNWTEVIKLTKVDIGNETKLQTLVNAVSASTLATWKYPLRQLQPAPTSAAILRSPKLY